MWALVAIETIYVHLFAASAYAILHSCFWASTFNMSILISGIVAQLLLYWYAWWALDGVVDFGVVFQTSQQQRKWELLAAVEAEGKSTPAIPKFVLDLDTPPSERWDEIVTLYVERGETERMKEFMVGQLIQEFGKVGAVIISLIMRIILTAHARFSMPPEYRQELLGISRLTSCRGLSYFDLLQLNYGGDFVANCTSAVVRCCGADLSPVHLRNMDWFPQQSLRPLTVDIDFKKKGHTVFSSTMWVFFVGTHTAMKRRGVPLDTATGIDTKTSSNLFSISMNFRLVEEGVYQNLLRAVSSEACHWPQGLLVRHVAEHAQGYHQALEWLMQYPLLAPCYFIVGGSGECDGAVVERDGGTNIHSISRLSSEQHNVMKDNSRSKSHHHYVLMTNCDSDTVSVPLSWTHEDPLLMNSLRRRQEAEHLIRKHFTEPDNKTSILSHTAVNIMTIDTDAEAEATKEHVISGSNVLSSAPVNNYQTVFGVVMVPGRDLYESRLWTVSDDSKMLDKRIPGGGYTQSDLDYYHVTSN